LSEAVAVIGSDGRLTLSNPAFAKLWKVSPKELPLGIHISEILELGQKYFNYSGPWEDFKGLMIQSITDRIPKKGQMKRKDKVLLEYSYTPLPDGGNLISYTDITNNDRIKQVLIQKNNALENADRMKSEFVAHISYELRSPLNSILGFTEMLSKNYFGPLNDKQSEYIAGIHEASSQLLDLINDMLDLSSMEAGYASLNLGEVNIKTILESVLDLIEPHAHKKGLEFKGYFPSQLGFMWGDDRRLKQILSNLLMNAVQFTPSGGKVSLEVSHLGDEIMFLVKDTGCGISKKDQRRLFKKFERGTIGVGGGHQGAGLGLALVKQLVDLHGGKVSLRSMLNEGTEVICCFPVSNVCGLHSKDVFEGAA
jgi:signal transduction histidine kinase